MCSMFCGSGFCHVVRLVWGSAGSWVVLGSRLPRHLKSSQARATPATGQFLLIPGILTCAMTPNSRIVLCATGRLGTRRPKNKPSEPLGKSRVQTLHLDRYIHLSLSLSIAISPQKKDPGSIQFRKPTRCSPASVSDAGRHRFLQRGCSRAAAQ